MTLTLWILIMMNAPGHTPAVVVDRFSTEKDCYETVRAIETKSEEKKMMNRIVAICVEAKVYRRISD